MNERARPGKGLTLYAIAAYLYLYLPIFFLVLFSFNTSKFSVKMEGLTLKWYGDLFRDKAIWMPRATRSSSPSPRPSSRPSSERRRRWRCTGMNFAARAFPKRRSISPSSSPKS